YEPFFLVPSDCGFSTFASFVSFGKVLFLHISSGHSSVALAGFVRPGTGRLIIGFAAVPVVLVRRFLAPGFSIIGKCRLSRAFGFVIATVPFVTKRHDFYRKNVSCKDS